MRAALCTVTTDGDVGYARVRYAPSQVLLTAAAVRLPAPAVAQPPELLDVAVRVAHGFRNLADYRLRLLLTVSLDWRTVTWQAAPATPIRGRSPRLVA